MLEKKRLFSVLVKSKYLSINMRFFFFKLEAVFILSCEIFLFKSNRRLNQQLFTIKVMFEVSALFWSSFAWFGYVWDFP